MSFFVEWAPELSGHQQSRWVKERGKRKRRKNKVRKKGGSMHVRAQVGQVENTVAVQVDVELLAAACVVAGLLGRRGFPSEVPNYAVRQVPVQQPRRTTFGGRRRWAPL